MEQTTQQITQKLPLPIKTKIAAWWMIVIGVSSSTIYFNNFPILIQIILPFLLVLLSGVFLLKKKRWSYWSSMATLSLIIFSPFSMFFLPVLSPFYVFGGAITAFIFNFLKWRSIVVMVGSLIYLIPLILLLLDRKNFWKIAS